MYIMFYVLIEYWHILKENKNRRLLCLLSRDKEYTKFIYICNLENHTKDRLNIDNIMIRINMNIRSYDIDFNFFLTNQMHKIRSMYLDLLYLTRNICLNKLIFHKSTENVKKSKMLASQAIKILQIYFLRFAQLSRSFRMRLTNEEVTAKSPKEIYRLLPPRVNRSEAWLCRRYRSL